MKVNSLTATYVGISIFAAICAGFAGYRFFAGPTDASELGDPGVLRVWKTLQSYNSKMNEPPAAVQSLAGHKIRVAGYFIVNELEGDNLNEFLLTPIAGGCVHVPPPPPNYVIYVKMKGQAKVKMRWTPIIVEGVFNLAATPADREKYLYEIDGEKVDDYPYDL